MSLFPFMGTSRPSTAHRGQPPNTTKKPPRPNGQEGYSVVGTPATDECGSRAPQKYHTHNENAPTTFR